MTFHAQTTGSLEYFEDGPADGAPLVMLHGTGADAELNFAHLLRYLPGRRFIRPNLPGSGANPELTGVDLDSILNRLARLHEETTDAPIDLLGFSLGAVLAAAYAGRYPDRVRKLVLVAGWAAPDPRHRLFMRLWRELADLDATAYSRFLMLAIFSPEFISRLGDAGITEALKVMEPSPGISLQIELDEVINIRAEAGQITAPTLLIAGDQDVLVPTGKVRELAGLIAGSAFVELASGHMVLAEQARAAAGLIEDFLG